MNGIKVICDRSSPPRVLTLIAPAESLFSCQVTQAQARGLGRVIPGGGYSAGHRGFPAPHCGWFLVPSRGLPGVRARPRRKALAGSLGLGRGQPGSPLQLSPGPLALDGLSLLICKVESTVPAPLSSDDRSGAGVLRSQSRRW